MNTTKTPILSILALLNSTLAPTISKAMTHAGTLPWPLSAPGYGRIPYTGRHHAHVSVQLDGAHVVLGPHGRHGHRGQEHHVVQHGGQQQRAQGAHGAQVLQQGAASIRRATSEVT